MKSPATGTDVVTLTSTAGTSSVRTFTLDSIVITGATVTLSGSRALRLVSKGGIALDKVTFDASPEVGTVSLSGCNVASTLSVAGTARLGGFNGGALEAAASTYGTLAGSAPAINAGKGNVKVRAGGAGGSHYGRGGQQGSSSLNFQAVAGLTYLKSAGDALVGGSGGGGGSKSDRSGQTESCTGGTANTQSAAAVGGAGGGAIEFEAQGGDVWLGSETIIRAHGGDVVYPLYGGAGAGGRIRIGVHGPRVIGIVSGAQLSVRGGYVDPIYEDPDLKTDCSSSAKDPCYIGQTTNGGGGLIAFFNAGSGVASVRSATSAFDVRSGNYRCPSGTCFTCAGCGSATDGAVLFGQGSEVTQDTANAPGDLSAANPNPDALCNTLTTSMASPTEGSSAASSLNPAGGDGINVTISMPPGVPSRRIDTTKKPRLFVGRFECPSASAKWVSVFGSTSSAAAKATARCSSTAPGVGSGLNLTVTFSGSQAGVTEAVTFQDAVGFSAPTVAAWSAPRPASRYAATASAVEGPGSPSFNITVLGSGFGGPGNSDLVSVLVGGQPCAAISVRNDSAVDCKAPPNVGSDHLISLSAGGQAATGTLSAFSYAPPEIHQISLAPGANASAGLSFATSGGQVLSIRGFNFGARVWSGSASVAATAQLVGASVTVGGQSCSDVVVESDRAINCTTPAWGGKLQALVVSIDGQAVTATASADTRSERRAAASGTVADASFHTGRVSGFSEARAVNFSSPSITLATFPDTSATAVAGAASPLLLPTTGGSVRLSGSSFGGASGAPLPVIMWDGVALGAAAVSRASDTSLTALAPAGVGANHVLRVLPSDGVSPGPQPDWVAVAYSRPTLSSLSTTSGLAQAGGTTLTVLGSNFGPLTAPVPAVFFGASRCGAVARSAGSLAHVQLSCTTPSGVGQNLAVIASVGGQNSTGSLLTSYAQPDVQAVSPTYAFAALTGVTWDVNVTGTGLGAQASHVSDLRIGGAACPPAAQEWVSSGLVRCRALPASALQVGSSAVRLATGGFYAADDVNFLVLGQPVFNIDPDFSSAPTANGGKMRLLASSDSFGFASADVVAVDVGGANASSSGAFAVRYSCASPRRTASGVLECDMPPGVGSALHVRVTTRGGAANDFQPPGNRLWSYLAPTLSALEPASVTFNANVTAYNFTIWGSNFGTDTELPTTVIVGGFACPTVEFANASVLRCVGLATPAAGAWLSTTVSVTVGGQSVTASIFAFSGAPRLTGASPPTGPSAGGTNVTLVGAELGNSLSDIDSVSVNGRRCLREFFVSSEEVVCTVPPGVGVDLAIRLVSDAGVTAQLDRAFSYAAPVLRAVVPSHVITGDLVYNLTVTGDNLATALDVPELVIAGVRCPAVEVRNASAVRCIGLPASGGWVGSAVSLRHPAASARGADILTAFGPPTAIAVSPPGGSVDGGDVVRVIGENFGRHLAEVASVTIGGRPCALQALLSPNIIEVRTPAGIGRLRSVVLTNIGGRDTSASPVTFSYDSPTLTALVPNRVLTGPLVSYDFNITGANLGNVFDVPPARDLLVGGRSCSEVVVVASTFVRCLGVSAAIGWQSADIAITVGGQSAVAFGLVNTMPSPQVTLASPLTIPTSGGVNVTVQGRGFGFESRDITSVTIGGRACTDVALGQASDVAPIGSLLSCTAPPGIRALRPIIVSTRAGSTSAPSRLVSYAAPVISGVVPDKLLAGNPDGRFAYNLTIRGSGFGSHPEDEVTSVLVAGRACARIERRNDSVLDCVDLPAEAGWLGSDAVVTVGEQTGVRTAAVIAFPAPRVEAVSPQVLPQAGASGDLARRVVIVGSSFGTVDADVQSVTLGGTPCDDITLQSSTRLECTARNGTGRSLSVTVVNSAGGRSPENGLFSFMEPTISAISPEYVFLSPSLSYNFTISGAGFGFSSSDVVSVTIGDNPCSAVRWMSSSLLGCDGVSGASWDTRAVAVEVRKYATVTVSLLRVYRQPTVKSVRPVSGPPSGRSSSTPVLMFIACEGCGEDPLDVVSASVGGQPCTGARLLLGNEEVECRLPPGTGTGKSVSVVVRGGASSASNSFFSYWGPVFSSVAPTSLLAGDAALYNVSVVGRHFGRDAGKMVLQLGGRRCDSILGPKADGDDDSLDVVTCVGVQPSLFSTEPAVQSSVVLQVDSQTVSQSGVLTVAPNPAITSLTPSTGTAAGGFNMTIKGPLNSFGFQPSDVLGVRLGDLITIWPPLVHWESGSTLIVTMPAGTGAGLDVEVLRRDGAEQEAPVRFSYLGPVLVSVSPSRLLGGSSDTVYNLTVVGSGFGVPGAASISLYIGGTSGFAVDHVNETVIVARGVQPALFSADESARRRVRIVVSGQEAILDGELFVLGQPIVQIARANGGSVMGGFRVDVSGADLAFVRTDIVAVSVGPYAVNLTTLVLQSSSQFSFAAPSGIGSGLAVVFTRVDGASSVTGSQGRLSYASPEIGSAAPLYLLPGPRPLNITLTGTNLASAPSDVEALAIGPAPCPSVEVLPPTMIRCIGMVWERAAATVAEIRRPDATFFLQPPALETQPQLSLSRASPGIVSTAGGTEVTLFGSGFGEDIGDIEQATIGGLLAEVLSVAARGEQLVLRAPGGTGLATLVRVVSVSGASSESASLLRYAAPAVASVSPAFAYAATSVLLRINGTGFASEAVIAASNAASELGDVLVQANLGAQAEVERCVPDAATITTTSFECRLARTPAAAGGASVNVVVSGQHSQPEGILRIVGPPNIGLVAPATDGTSGGAVVTITGSALGEAARDVLNVSIGGASAELVAYTDAASIRVRIPPGVGRGLDVRVCTPAGCSPANGMFAFSLPRVLRVVPDSALLGTTVEDFIIEGENFGRSSADVEAVRIGGSPCAGVELLGANSIRCTGVRGDMMQEAARDVEVRVGAQDAPPNALFTPVGAPRIDFLSPNVAAPGDVILLFGGNFGRSQDDLVNVSVAGVPCDAVEFVSPVAVRCAVPQRPPALQALVQATGDTSFMRGLSVRVVTAGLLSTDPNTLFTFSGSGLAPLSVPLAVSGFRPQGSSSSITLRWFFRDRPSPLDVAGFRFREADLAAIEPASEFRIEWVRAERNGTGLAAAPGADILQARVSLGAQSVSKEAAEQDVMIPLVVDRHRSVFGAATNLSLATTDAKGYGWVRTALNGFERHPYVLRVCAESPSGSGPCSAWSDPIFESCGLNEFLATHLEFAVNMTCQDCPDTLAFCGGLPAEKVVAQRGAWRVPGHRSTAVAFATCPRVESCDGWLGVESLRAVSVLARSNSSSVSNAGAASAATAAQEASSLSRLLQWEERAGFQPMADHGVGLNLPPLPGTGRAGLVWGASRSGTGIRHVTRALQSTSPARAAADLSLALDPERAIRDPTATWEDLVPLPLPEARAVRPADFEGCAEGYSGVLCSACVQGWTRAATYSCAPCAPTWQLYLMLVVIVLAVFFVIGFVISRALKQKGAAAKPEVQLIKIILTAMQQVSIASGFELQWPVEVTVLFAGMDSISSVSTSVLALDCLIPDTARNLGFFFKTVAVLASPVALTLGLVAFWMLRWRLQLCLDNRRARGGRSPKKVAAVADKAMPSTLATQSSPLANRPGALLPALPDMRGGKGKVQSNPLALSRKPTSAGTPARLPALLTAPGRGGPAAAGPGSEPKPKPASKRLLSQQRLARLIRKAAAKKLAEDAKAPKTRHGGRREAGSGSNARKASFATIARIAARKSATWSHTRDRLIVSIFVILFMIHTTVTRAALSLFTCRWISDETGRDEATAWQVLTADMTVGCHDAATTTWKLVAGVPTFLLFSCGIPVAAYLALRRERHKLEQPRVRQTYGFLYAGFRQHVYYWETVVMARKVLLSVIVVFLEPYGIDVQAYVALALLFAAALLHVSTWPYEESSANALELLSLVACFATITLGLVTYSPNSTFDMRTAASVVIFLVQGTFIIAALWLLVSTTLASCRRDSIVGRIAQQVSRRTTVVGRNSLALLRTLSGRSQRSPADSVSSLLSVSATIAPTNVANTDSSGAVAAGSAAAGAKRASASPKAVAQKSNRRFVPPVHIG